MDTHPLASRLSVLAGLTIGAILATAGAALWGLGQSARVAPEASVAYDIDLNRIAPGEEIRIATPKGPVLVRHLTERELQESDKYAAETLPDPEADNPNVSRHALATRENRSLVHNGTYVVFWAACPDGFYIAMSGAGDFNAWFCPKYAQHYDFFGRAQRGHQPENLKIPPYRLSQDGILSILIDPAVPATALVDDLLYGNTQATSY